MNSAKVHILSGFDDARLDAKRWEELHCRGETNTVFSTRQWLRAWWETLGRGVLLLTVLEQAGEITALAPFYALDGVVFFLGSGESDYLDFIGTIDDAEMLATILAAVRERAPGFSGFNLYLVPSESRTGELLRETALKIGLECFEVSEVFFAVDVNLELEATAVRRAVGNSMLQREEYFRRRGPLTIDQLDQRIAIQPFLEEFYELHRARWANKGIRSPFADPDQRAFLERFLELAADTGWVRFLRIVCGGRPVAAEFAWYYRGTHFSGPWCFAIDEANHSPGHVLLRQSVLKALASGLHKYDLGLGEQPYKFRLPVQTKRCRSWKLYPPDFS